MIYQGDSLEILQAFQADSIDALVTDPPAGISFMGKEWDSGKDFIPWLTAIMKECLRVLKPGAHGFIWALPRTSHWTATALEDAEFEIRDVVTHLFGSGFPKSLDVSKAIDKAAGAEREVIGQYKSPEAKTRENTKSTDALFHKEQLADSLITAPTTPEAKQWQGWGTALKPASEHWILIRKPIEEDTVASNVLKYETGGINIDVSRIHACKDDSNISGTSLSRKAFQNAHTQHTDIQVKSENLHDDCNSLIKSQGRFPANLILDEEAAQMLDEQSGITKSTGGKPASMGGFGSNGIYGTGKKIITANAGGLGDVGGASRFFYVAKCSKSERNAGCGINGHPTVKPKKLMSYLINMITPPGGIVIDPFMGSGSTGVACIENGFQFIGIEKEKEYFEMAEKRIKHGELQPCLL